MSMALKALLATSILLTAPAVEEPGVTISDYANQNKIDYIYIDPLKSVNSISKMTIMASFSSSIKEGATLYISVKNDTYPKGKRIATISLPNKQNKVTYSYNQRYSSINNSFNYFVFELESPLGNDSVMINMKNYEQRNLYVSDGSIDHSSPLNLVLYKLNTGLRYVKEEIKVTKCSSSYSTTKSLTLPISNFNFTYTAPDRDVPFSYSNPRLVIETHDGYFSHLGSVLEGPIRKIPLKVNYFALTGTVSFSIDCDLYVHPTSKDLSTTPIEGYVKTSKFHFPTNVKNNETFTVRYMMDDVGANSYSFVYEFSVFINKKSFGNCLDSYYCLSTEESDPDTSLGVKISH